MRLLSLPKLMNSTFRAVSFFVLFGILLLGIPAIGQEASHSADAARHTVVHAKHLRHVLPAIRISGGALRGGEEAGANYWFYQRRAWPNAYIDPAMYPNALRQAHAMPLWRPYGKMNVMDHLTWSSIGPYSIDGRVTCLVAHPTDSNLFYVGAAAGGLWKTTDHGQTWKCVTDTFGSLSIGAIAMDPSDPNTLYVGQGEPNNSADSYPGNGIWKTTDAGVTWHYLGLGGTAYVGQIVIDPRNTQVVYVAAPGPSPTYDSTRGIYKSTDGGASWTRSLLARAGNYRNSRSIGAWDIAMNPANSNELIATLWQTSGNAGNCGPYSSIWMTHDAGSTWTRIDTIAGNGLLSGMEYGRLARAAVWWSPGDGSHTYVYVAETGVDTNIVTGYSTDVNFHGLYRSSDEGSTWELMMDSTYKIPFGLFGRDSTNPMNMQGGYDLFLTGNPYHPNELYFGGIDVLRSSDYGKTWSDITRSYSDYYIKGDRDQHSDQHAIATTAASGGNDLLIGSDGGVFETRDFGTTWKQLQGLPITMFYAIEPWAAGMASLGATITPDQLKVFGGTQDNGTVSKGLSTDTNFVWINAGDGGDAQSHPTDSSKVITSIELGSIYARNSLDSLTTVTPIRDADGRTGAWHKITKSLLYGVVTDTNEPAAFIAPVVLDKSRPTELYTSRLHVYKATIDWNDLDHVKWSVWSPQLAGKIGDSLLWYYGDLETMALGARDAKGRPMLWAGGSIYESPSSALWRTVVDNNRPDSVAPQWVKRNQGLPGTTVSDILADPTDSMHAIVTTLGSGVYDKHVFETHDGGATWVNISGNLPNAPVSAIVADTAAEHGDPSLRYHCLIVGTDVGVYVTIDGGVKWSLLAEGMPPSVVGDVQIYKNLLIAATHGRSLYAVDISSLNAVPASVEPASTPVAISVYPNPVHRGDAVTIDGLPRVTTVSLVSESSGIRTVVAVDGRSLTIPATLSAGAYVVRATANGKTVEAALVVQP